MVRSCCLSVPTLSLNNTQVNVGVVSGRTRFLLFFCFYYFVRSIFLFPRLFFFCFVVDEGFVSWRLFITIVRCVELIELHDDQFTTVGCLSPRVQYSTPFSSSFFFDFFVAHIIIIRAGYLFILWSGAAWCFARRVACCPHVYSSLRCTCTFCFFALSLTPKLYTSKYYTYRSPTKRRHRQAEWKILRSIKIKK